MQLTTPLFSGLTGAFFTALLSVSTPSWAASELLIEYANVPGEIADAQPSPLVQIYKDGRVVATYPVYMKRAGTWVGTLSADELQALQAKLAAMAADDMTAELSAAVSEVESAGNANGLLYSRSGGATTKLLLAGENGMHEMQWKGLRGDAKRFDIAGLKAIAALEQEVLDMANNLQQRASAGDQQ